MLAATWEPAHGFPGVLSEVNNQVIGTRFMVTAFIFFLIGGLLALLMRIQLTVAENDFLGPQTYNELFTMHGSTMMFLFAVPFLEGLALYLLPMMIGARDVAFPRLTAYGYWVYLFGGILFYVSFLVGAVPDIGWFGYTPLSTSRFTGISTDFWLLGLSLVEVAGLTAAVEIVVTILKFRAPGMTIGRLPLLVLSLLVVGVMILIAFSVLLTATILLELDRALNTAFFDLTRGGNNLLWQHLFWFFGHPEVYIMFLPATGIISMVIPVFSRRPIVGYVWIAVAILLTGFVSFGLWVHHMFAAGLPDLAMTFFTAASLMIAIASGIQIFSWIATMWGSRPTLTVPMLYALGFVFLFVLGGLTGVMVAMVPFDQQVHDTYFIVAHFHYVLIGGVIFPIFAGIYYWTPKISGRMLVPLLGYASFWTTFIGFNLTFFPMHIMGFLGLPRRVYTYSKELQLDSYNMVATAGAGLLGLGALLFLVDLIYSLFKGAPAGDNPWQADSLEWSVASPPPNYTFFFFPIVSSRHPLWSADTLDESSKYGHLSLAMAGQPQTWRGTLVTDATDANPQAIQFLPSPCYVPFWTAVATLAAAVGILLQAYILSAFAILMLVICLVIWLYPDTEQLNQLVDSELTNTTGLPTIPTSPASVVWWATIGFNIIMGSAFAALIYSYFYIRLFSSQWPQDGVTQPTIWPSLAGVLAITCAFWIARGLPHKPLWQDRKSRTMGAIAIAVACGMYLGLQLWDWAKCGFVPSQNACTSLFFVITASSMLTAALVGTFSAFAVVRLISNQPIPQPSIQLHLEVVSLLSVLLLAIGVLTFVSVYLSPIIF